MSLDQSFIASPSRKFNAYVILHFIFLLLIIGIYFLNQNELEAAIKIEIGVYMILSVISFGLSLKNKPLAIYIELVRMASILVIVAVEGANIDDRMVLYTFLTVSIVSIAVLLITVFLRALLNVYEY